MTRLVVPPGASRDLSSEGAPSLLVYVSTRDAGTVRWLPKESAERLTNTTAEGVEVLRFELRTLPVTSR